MADKKRNEEQLGDGMNREELDESGTEQGGMQGRSERASGQPGGGAGGSRDQSGNLRGDPNQRDLGGAERGASSGRGSESEDELTSDSDDVTRGTGGAGRSGSSGGTSGGNR